MKFISKLTPTMPKRSSRPLHFAVIFLVLFGFIMVMSTYAGKNPEEKSLAKEVIESLVFMVGSYIAMCVVAKNFNIRKLQKWHWIIGGILIIMMVGTLFFPETYGARAWLRLGPLSIQPVEFVKVFMILILALYIELIKNSKRSLIKLIKVPLLYYLIFAVIIAFQKDFGALIILTLIIVCLIFCTTQERFKKLQKVLLVLMVLAGILVAFCFTQQGVDLLAKIPFISYFAIRFQNTLNPFIDTANYGYQMVHGLYGFARGGLQGVGLGNSIQKYGYLTQSESDYILSIIVEETGLIGLSIVVICYAVMLHQLFYYAFKAKSEGYRFILIGTGFYIFAHFFLNVGGVSGLIPLTGVPLLFISSGGSSLLSIMMCIGFAQSVISIVRRSGSAQKKKKRAS